MKIGFNPGSIVDLNGSPLVGRVTIYEHDSEIVKTVYTLEGETYTQAENPQLLNVAGRLDDTLYFDASVVDVKVERYVGEEGLMSEESPDEDFETFDVYSYGFTLDIGTAGEIVDTVDDLRTTPDERRDGQRARLLLRGGLFPAPLRVGCLLLGYRGRRLRLASSLTAEGRWILAYDGETIPCTWYGVRPNNLSNIASLLGYPRHHRDVLQSGRPRASISCAARMTRRRTRTRPTRRSYFRARPSSRVGRLSSVRP